MPIGVKLTHVISRIERNVEAGSIKIYFDDMKTPIMEVNFKHYVKGNIRI